LGCDKPFETCGAVIKAMINGMDPAPSMILQPVKNARESISEGIKVIWSVG